MPSAGLVVSTAGISAILIFVIRWILGSRPKTSVQNKVVLITGASSGLGEACAHAFFRAGAKVILCARRQDELERVKSDLLKLTHVSNQHPPRILCLDLSDLSSIEAKASEACSYHGNIDILINNGGISYRGEVIETELQVDKKIMLVNYFGQIALTKAFLPSMIEKKEGHIVAVSSVQGKIAIPHRSAYAASKHAVQAFFDCLRAEVAHHNIHVSVMSPGYIKTNLSRNALTGDGSAYGVMDTTTESGATPSHIAHCILKAVTHRQEELVIAAFSHRLAIALRNILPHIFFLLMKKRAKKLRNSNME